MREATEGIEGDAQSVATSKNSSNLSGSNSTIASGRTLSSEVKQSAKYSAIEGDEN